MFPELIIIRHLFAVAPRSWQALRADPEAGYSTEAVIVTALLAALALTAVGIIVAKVVSSANNISTNGGGLSEPPGATSRHDHPPTASSPAVPACPRSGRARRGLRRTGHRHPAAVAADHGGDPVRPVGARRAHRLRRRPTGRLGRPPPRRDGRRPARPKPKASSTSSARACSSASQHHRDPHRCHDAPSRSPGTPRASSGSSPCRSKRSPSARPRSTPTPGPAP